MSATLGVDVGGTFTDFFLVDEESGETRTHKVASTPDDPSRAILQGLRALAPEGGLVFLAHGTTVATNALIQRRGGKVTLVTTAGFKDLLEIGRQTRPKIYDLKADHPEPLVPREHRFEVAERIGPTGEVIAPLCDADIRRAIADVKGSGAESVAVCFLFSFLNPQHERRLGEALRAALPGVDVSLSCEVQPEFREYERLSTTVLNAFLQPVAGRYMTRLEAAVEQHAAGAGIGICQSSGGLMSVERAAEMPIRTALSGPAAGVVGAVAAGARAGRSDLITFDMGGTSTDVCLVRDGKAEMAFGRSVAGFPVRLPSIDIHTVGAGGGVAVREGLPASAWGENSEALFLTSSFVQPDAATAAARFANEEEAFIYSRFTNPTVTMMERRLAALEGHRSVHRDVERHERDPAARHGPAEGRRPRRLLAERVRLDGDAVRPRVRQVRRRDDLRLADRRRRVARRDEAEHEAAVRRVADQPAHRGVRHPRARRDRASPPVPAWRSTTASARRPCSGRSSTAPTS